MITTRALVVLLAGCAPAQPTLVAEALAPKDVQTPEPEAAAVAADEPAFLAGIFRQTPLQELSVKDEAVDESVGQVKLELRFFTVAGTPLAAQVNEAVRKLGRLDEWERESKGRGGTVFVTCTAGLAYAELVSFGCDIMDSTLTLEEIAQATGGAPGAPTGYAQTLALNDGKPTPVALTDLLVAIPDLTALAKRAAVEDEFPDESWSVDRCEVGGDPVWQLELGGLRVWDKDDSCVSQLIPYEMLAPALEPGGVIARYLAITSAAG
jgi:hypothetical protein